jgi:outer membrane protease
MKNIVFFLLFVSMFFALQNANCEEGEKGSKENSKPWGYAFSVSPVFGMLWGKGEEIVYKSPDSDIYLSQLLWDFTPLWYIGAEIDFGPRNPFEKRGFTASASVKFGISAKTGNMEDRDWEDIDDDFLTKYSKHDALSKGTLWTEFSAGYSWAFLSRITLGVYGEFSYLRLSWEGVDGYFQYALFDKDTKQGNAWDPSLPKDNYNGSIIDYTQYWFMLAPSIVALFRISNHFILGFSIAWTPLIYGICADDHHHPEKKVYYQDYLLGGFLLKDRLDLVYSFNERIAFKLSTGSRLTGGSRGDTYHIDTSETSNPSRGFSKNSGGGGFRFLDISLSAKVRF